MGTFLRALKFGRVRQLDAVAARFLTGLTVHGGLIDTATLITSIWTTRSGEPMDMPSRAAVRFLRRQGAQCVAGNGLLGSPGAGDRGDQVVERVSELGRRRGPPTTGSRSSRPPSGAAPTSPSPPARTAPSPPRSAPSPTRVGRSYPERCSTNSSSSGCPTPRSPRFPSPRSHPAARPVRCGLIDPSRKRPGLWHLTLFDWNRATKPSVRPL